VVFDREDTVVNIGTADQDFIRNIVRVLAETRLGFAVIPAGLWRSISSCRT
jgi:hypothetical protein